MARLRLTPPPAPSPQADPNPGQVPGQGLSALPAHLARPLTPQAWQQQFDATQAAGGLGALALQDARAAMPPPAPPAPPLSMGGRIAEGFEGVARGGLAALERGTQALRAPFYTQDVDPATGAPVSAPALDTEGASGFAGWFGNEEPV